MEEMEKVQPEDSESDMVVMDASIAMTASDRAQIDVQVMTAKQYPRSVTAAMRRATELATLDQGTAASCIYALPRDGKIIDGPSARLAEIVAYAWTNIRVQAEVTAIDDRYLTATATCMDLENNVGYRVSVKRRITDKHGKRYKDDMIVVTGNAACSIASRNVVFKVVPKALWEPIYKRARAASAGSRETFEQQRKKAMEWAAKVGIGSAQVFELLGVKGIEDIGLDELITLHGIRTAIEEGDTTVEHLLAKSNAPTDGATKLNEALKETQTSGTQANTKAQNQRAPKDPPELFDTDAHSNVVLS